jgi:Phage tail assembly chaperone
MFTIKQTDSYEWTVKVEMPMSGDRRKTETFKAEFKRLPQSRIEELQKLITSEQLPYKDFIREILVGWKDVDDGGNPLEFSQAALDQLCDVQLVAVAIVNSFFGSLNGAKVKN